MANKQVKRILIAPLDWGLGHTSRCIPLVRHIFNSGHTPIFAGNEKQRTFIKKYFPNIEDINLDGYNISFSGGLLPIIFQIPTILKAIKTENSWILSNVKKLELDGIISDNRYGLYCSSIPSIILTHQLQIQTGLGSIIDRMVQKLHYKYLNNFDSVWVVDIFSNNNIAGKLSKCYFLPKNVEYIGLLSQFADLMYYFSENPKNYYLILLSGPEPQRSIISDILWNQVIYLNESVVFVEGSLKVKCKRENIPTHILHYDLLSNVELLNVIKNANLIFCRSGYSTIMDLIALNKKAILIPTPGQTEQEYLAKYLKSIGLFFTTEQCCINLADAIRNSQQQLYNKIGDDVSFTLYKNTLDRWIETL